jgi:hypothetical protein
MLHFPFANVSVTSTFELESGSECRVDMDIDPWCFFLLSSLIMTESLPLQLSSDRVTDTEKRDCACFALAFFDDCCCDVFVLDEGISPECRRNTFTGTTEIRRNI